MEPAGYIKLGVNTLLEPFTLEKYNTGLYDVVQRRINNSENIIKVVSVYLTNRSTITEINGYFVGLDNIVSGVRLYQVAGNESSIAFLKRKVINTYPARLLEFKYMLFEAPYNGPTNRLNVLLSNTKETQGGYNFCLEIK